MHKNMHYTLPYMRGWTGGQGGGGGGGGGGGLERG